MAHALTSSTVARDPFARGEYRRFASGHAGDCAWCGQTRRVVYSYVWEPDDRPTRATPRDAEYWFCNLDCFRAFAS